VTWPSARSAAASRTTDVASEWPPGPSPLRGAAVIGGLALTIWLLAGVGRHSAGVDRNVETLGRLEVTARLLGCPDPFPDLGAYRYTYVVEYEIVAVHRQNPAGKYVLHAGDHIFIGHYQPRLPRNVIRDADWGDAPLGGNLTRIVQGDLHRMALDYQLAQLAPSGALDYCYPPDVKRFFAIWTNRASP
jgi:hypothetical protein